ncbi:hypothetical protein D1007_54787 [Hordeum vulgare]|nr:hypothetical protein D1007_54787 [Hordeum vulgare]
MKADAAYAVQAIARRQAQHITNIDDKEFIVSKAHALLILGLARRPELRETSGHGQYPFILKLSECEATEKATTKAKVARHAKKQEHVLRRLSGMRCNSDEDDSDVSTTSGFDDDDDAPPHAEAYTEEGHISVDDRKGKGAARKW